MKLKPILIFLFLSFSFFCNARVKIVGNGSIYASWGYNKEWYSKSNLHISQPGLGNEYMFENLKGHNNPGWNKNIFHKHFTIPQYNYRIGYFFDPEQKMAFEINFDHTKYIATENQTVRVKGTMNHLAIDSNVITTDSVLIWYLNNGANFLQFNLVRKFTLLDLFNSNINVIALTKAGIGPVIPHVQNTIFGNQNNANFQFGGWNVLADVSIRATFLKHVFVEYCNKAVYARYSNLKIYQGTARQAFACHEMILFAGFTARLGKYQGFKPQPQE